MKYMQQTSSDSANIPVLWQIEVAGGLGYLELMPEG